jgi:hypothetical protein
MKKKLLYVYSNQHGSVINVALLILILIFLIGIGLSRMSTTDIKIANNIKQDMTTFYGADAGLDAASEMIEQNIACITGFDDTPTGTDSLPTGEEIIGGYFYVKDLDFSQNFRSMAYRPRETEDIDGDGILDPSEDVNNNGVLDIGEDTNGNGVLDLGEDLNGNGIIDTPAADIYYPPNLTEPHTNIKVGGATRFSKGSAIQMAAGYEGLGKGAAGGGASLIFDVYAQRIDANNNSEIHFIQWVHILGSSGACNY